MDTGAAVFDFDRTLIRQESMAMFLRAMVGGRVYVSACCAASTKAVMATPRRRLEVFRAEMLRRTLIGKTVTQAQEAAEGVFTRLDWVSRILEALTKHRDAGRRILIATGSLSIYMPAFLEMGNIRVDSLLATEIGIDGDILTGEMATASCTRMEKARRVKTWLSSINGSVWGYGNLPHDEATLALTDYPIVV